MNEDQGILSRVFFGVTGGLLAVASMLFSLAVAGFFGFLAFWLLANVISLLARGEFIIQFGMLRAVAFGLFMHAGALILQVLAVLVVWLALSTVVYAIKSALEWAFGYLRFSASSARASL